MVGSVSSAAGSRSAVGSISAVAAVLSCYLLVSASLVVAEEEEAAASGMCSTEVQHITLQHSTVQYSTVRYNTFPYIHTVQYKTENNITCYNFLSCNVYLSNIIKPFVFNDE